MKKEIAYEVVKYWHTIEFLSQKDFPKETLENKKKVYEERRYTNSKERNNVSKFMLIYDIPLSKEIDEQVQEDNQVYLNHQVISDSCYVCIGKLKREMCISSLYKYMGKTDDRPEEDKSEIAILGFKTSSSGNYNTGSFNISPLIWTLSKIRTYSTINDLSNIITVDSYLSDMKKYNKILDEYGIVTINAIKHLYNEVINDYIYPIFNISEEMNGKLIYHRYRDEKVKIKEDNKNEDLSQLNQSFYLDDLKIIMDEVASGIYGKNNSMQKDILDYIIEPFVRENKLNDILGIDKRIDIRNNQNELNQWLNIKNAPLGKWPSKFMPSLMQQVAINIAISNNIDLRKMFSVNGPPGTGKTTLLKEIIADNIVKRAELLARYEKSDDAFMEGAFEDGHLKENGYDNYFYKYYQFKDEELIRYGMLVASCNNAAVENITKELPDGESICNSLNSDSKKNNSEEILDLDLVKSMFDLSQVKSSENFRVKNSEDDGYTSIKKPDIYFSWLAHRLLTGDESEKIEFTEWGLISAPMGKSQNIKQYCYHVLNPLIEEFIKTNNKRDERQYKYDMIRNEFTNQLEKVRRIQKDIEKVYDLKTNLNLTISKLDIEKDKLNSIIEDYKKKIIDIKKKIINLENKLDETTLRYDNETKVANKLSIEKLEKLSEIANNKEHIDSLTQEIISLEDKLRLLDKIFALFGLTCERVNQITRLREEQEKLFLKEYQYKASLEDIEQKILEHDELLISLNESISKLVGEKEINKNEIQKFEKSIQQNNDLMEVVLNKIEVAIAQYNKCMEDVKLRMNVLDEEFWTKYKSSDINQKAIAHGQNPWMTFEYNREREKLFYLALQVHKEFILTSKCCRDNYCNLAMMWGNRNNSEKETVYYSKRDREKSYKHLLNSLFLFTPVMSTTFASVHNFLEDIKDAGTLGTLIIDEAGQAPPQVAIGAMHRFQKAIIVGDPKQVEPVVTDDADSLKEVFTNSILRAYHSKTISVQ